MARTSLRSFALKVMEKANYLDPQLIEQVYAGIVRYAVLELRDKGSVILPDFGTVKVVHHKPRRAHLINSTGTMELPARATVKFEACTRMKEYFRDIGKRP